MFTGIVSDIGEVVEVNKAAHGASARILCAMPASEIALGASIACDGVCLTVTATEAKGDGAIFDVDISPETLRVTNLDAWGEAAKINLEHAMRMGDEIGGHIVSGHVDGLAEIIRKTADGENNIFRLRAPSELARFIASKGSVCLNGTSLTVNAVEGEEFEINLIPHSLSVTNWKDRKTGDQVNLEIDMMARYVARLREFDG